MSLLEVAITLAIVGAATAIAVPKYFDSVERSRLANAANRVAQDITATRQRAITNGVPQSIVFDATGYTLSFRTLATSTTQRVDLTAPPYSAKSTAARVAGDATLTFDQFGASTTPALIAVRTGYLVRYISFSPRDASVEVTQASPLKVSDDSAMIDDNAAPAPASTSSTIVAEGDDGDANLVGTPIGPR